MVRQWPAMWDLERQTLCEGMVSLAVVHRSREVSCHNDVTRFPRVKPLGGTQSDRPNRWKTWIYGAAKGREGSEGQPKRPWG